MNSVCYNCFGDNQRYILIPVIIDREWEPSWLHNLFNRMRKKRWEYDVEQANEAGMWLVGQVYFVGDLI